MNPNDKSDLRYAIAALLLMIVGVAMTWAVLSGRGS